MRFPKGVVRRPATGPGDDRVVVPEGGEGVQIDVLTMPVPPRESVSRTGEPGTELRSRIGVGKHVHPSALREQRYCRHPRQDGTLAGEPADAAETLRLDLETFSGFMMRLDEPDVLFYHTAVRLRTVDRVFVLLEYVDVAVCEHDFPLLVEIRNVFNC